MSIAKQGVNLRWEWGDLALEVAPPSEREKVKNGNLAALNDLLERISDHGEIPMTDLPTAASLRDYRDGAAVVPPGEYRQGITIYFARELGHLEKDLAKRLAVIDKLRAEHKSGRATIDALRLLYGNLPTRTAGDASERIQSEIEKMSPSKRAAMAANLLSSDEVRKAVFNLDGDERTNIIKAAGSVHDQAVQRKEEATAIRRNTSPDERFWNLFKADLQPNWLMAGSRLGHFEWNGERVHWMQEKGDSLRDEFHRLAAENATLSSDDFNALLEGE